MRTALTFLTIALAAVAAAGADEARTFTFDDADALDAWTTKGGVELDDTHSRSGKALRIPPGGSAVLKLTDTPGAGKVELWVYEDMTVPENPKKRRVGPRWGLLGSSAKQALTVGAIYAPYLSGDKTYAASDYRGETWFMVSYLGEARRKAGWHRWTFTMDAEKGLSIAVDGKDVNARRKRFDWNKTQFGGMTGLLIHGDDGKGGKAQTIWVDDVTVGLGGKMKARPTPPPPPPPVVPEKDPAVEEAPELVEGVRGRHPRVLLGPGDVAALREFAGSDLAKPMWEGLMDYLPVCRAPREPKFLRDATDGQRHGFWRMPTVALHYLITEDPKSLEAAKGYMKLLLDLKHWEATKERDSGMSAGNVMVGAALLYDWTYDALDPDFRETYRKKLLWHARAMYHGGHMKKNRGPHYWQNDPANNHRWHRNAGLALCILAAYEGNEEEKWILARTAEELAYVHRWLPEDGTSHEGPGYFVFGGAHLTLAMQAADRCLGTSYLKHGYFRNGPLFRLHTLAPGMEDALPFGDSGGLGGYNNFLHKCCAVHRLADAQAGIARFAEISPKAFMFKWFSLIWRDPALEAGSLSKLPPREFFPDPGLATMRDAWTPEAVAAFFKCGPYGGYKLNEFRNENDFHYINVAHDDPDVNSFVLNAGGKMLAETSRYSKKKLTQSHNTILVNGKGQLGEGHGWTQPLKRKGSRDMTDLGVIKAYKDAGGVVVAEGEGAGSYPDLSRYRRTFVWVPGDYILLLDDIAAEGDTPVEVTWMVQGPKLQTRDADAGAYTLVNEQARCPFMVVPHGKAAAEIVDSTADHRGKPLGWRQLRVVQNGRQVRYAAVFDPWNRGGLTVATAPDGDAVKVTVTGEGIADTWAWTPAGGDKAAALKGVRGGKALIEVTEQDTMEKP